MKHWRLVVFLFCVGCSGVKIMGIDKTDDFSISKYKTFAFSKIDTTGSDAIGPNYQANLSLLKEAITKQMKAKGLTLNEDSPDMLVNIGITILEKVQTRETSFANPGDRTAYMGQRNYSWSSQEVEVGRYREGTVTVHLVDSKQNKLVWKGSADGVVPEKQKNIPALIDEAMTKLFEKIN